MKKIMIAVSILLFLLNEAWVSWGVVTVWGFIGLVKLLKYMAKRGAFD